MDKESHEQNNHTTSGDPLAKRKRGRPRKHFKLDDSNNNRSPPGFSRTQQHQDEAMVGQHVTGVIEASFEDGFLLSVKVGGTDAMLRGVVFKPGHFHPLSADNDVAPHVPMTRRNNNDLVDHRRSAAQGGRKSRLHEKRGARALVPVPIQPKPLLPPAHHGHMRTETESRVSGASNGKPFETLFTQVMEKGQVHTESEEQALSIEPLQAIHPVHPVHMPKPTPSYGRGNMTELLQAVQENVRETHFSQGQ
ncbi:unnamed protein product [Brassica oleracea var. botrytis]